jgi:hypothetical protein
MAQQWMSIIEYARQFSVSDMTVRRRIKNGKLYATLKEGKYFIPVDENHTPQADEDMDFLSRSKDDQISMNSPLVKNSQRPNSHLDFEFRHDQLPKLHSQVKENNRSSITENFPLPNFIGKFPGENTPSFASKTLEPDSIKEILEFANKTMALADEKYKAKEQEWNLRFKALEFEISTRDMRINTLKQQIEDLQLLVKVIESPN